MRIVKQTGIRGGVALLLASVLVACGVWLALAGTGGADAYNGYLEDCDFDGYDDETGAPVPWYGFDQTKGDTVPADWDGVAGSYSFTTNTGSGTGTDTGTGTDAGSDAAAGTDTGTAGSTSVGSQASATSTSSQTSAAASADVQETLAAAEATKATLSAEELAFVEEVTGIKGKLGFTAAGDADVFYPGGELIIRGEGFKGSVSDYTIEIHSEVKSLGSFDTAVDGSFEVTVSLPDDISLGRHNIWILYKGVPIVQKGLDVVAAPAAADGADVATEEAGNKGFAGFLILISVVAVAAVALIAFTAARKKKAAQAE
ncbi:MAG: hypothetical protein LBR14_03145 [Clostridiales Family XIII bacterium]|jgi:hypothetical protein|nr:hypothetical protein [Clostridiales Family XIII bacterium]